tara:strand:- start:1187 stop:1534 length:348 start_codon:yes stop_codon:yes gene_type:complete
MSESSERYDQIFEEGKKFAQNKVLEPMDHYEEGFTNGHEEGFNNGHEEGFADGKKFAQNKVLELMDEVIEQYELQANEYDYKAEHDRLNAVKFMKGWVLSGGTEDEDGNRVCLVW